MASKWDDEFDFDDLEPKPAAKKAKDQKKPKNKQDDFFDLEDVPQISNSKLPSINQKPK